MSALAYFFAFLLAAVMTGHSVDFIHVGHSKTHHPSFVAVYLHETHEQ